jgi:hypothetical protein
MQVPVIIMLRNGVLPRIQNCCTCGREIDEEGSGAEINAVAQGRNPESLSA